MVGLYLTCLEFDEGGLSPSKVVVAFQLCLWLRRGCPVVWYMTAECVSTTESTRASYNRWRAEGEDGPGTREGPAFELLEAPMQLCPACGGVGAQGRVQVN